MGRPIRKEEGLTYGAGILLVKIPDVVDRIIIISWIILLILLGLTYLYY